MKRHFLKISILTAITYSLFSCDAVKRVGENEHLLTGNNVTVNGKKNNTETMSNLLYQEPNNKMVKEQQFEKIHDSNLNQIYLQTIADVYSRSILDNIMEMPKSPIEISTQTQIPLRTVYRKLQSMFDDGIIKISGNITESGKKYFMYKSKIRGLQTLYSEQKISVYIIRN